uniref:Uncharacterized protein n=1 Tax=Romanomermis culicivorax TaxID=13658 RepID=A0A915HXD8_ROMCU
MPRSSSSLIACFSSLDKIDWSMKFEVRDEANSDSSQSHSLYKSDEENDDIYKCAGEPKNRRSVLTFIAFKRGTLFQCGFLPSMVTMNARSMKSGLCSKDKQGTLMQQSALKNLYLSKSSTGRLFLAHP